MCRLGKGIHRRNGHVSQILSSPIRYMKQWGQIIENSLIMRTMAGNTSMEKMEEILTLIDKRYGYAQDADIVYLMKNKRITDDDPE